MDCNDKVIEAVVVLYAEREVTRKQLNSPINTPVRLEEYRRLKDISKQVTHLKTMPVSKIIENIKKLINNGK